MPTSPTEEFLKLIWTRRLYTNRELATCDGRPLRVISHGNINPVAGTDITDAQIEIDGTVYSGPIAVHAQASLWRRHLHHIDMAYDDCILHLVLENDAVVCRVDGSVIPALILEYPESLDNTFRNLTEGEGRSLCCRELKRMPPVSLYNTLTRLTIERLERKYNDFLRLYTEAGNDWNEAFYITLFKSVGASRNREAYIKLARTCVTATCATSKSLSFRSKRCCWAGPECSIPSETDGSRTTTLSGCSRNSTTSPDVSASSRCVTANGRYRKPGVSAIPCCGSSNWPGCSPAKSSFSRT